MQNSLAAALFDALGALPTGVVPARLVLGYSGGLDSELLACALAEFARSKAATPYASSQCLLVHVHHGLSQHADEWARHCEARAAHYGLPLVVERVEVKRGPRLSLEAEARNARYRALLSHLAAGDVLLTAHHEDDQLETVLLALSRGLGPKGLAAMGLCQPLQLSSAHQTDERGSDDGDLDEGCSEEGYSQQGYSEDKGRTSCAWQLRPFLGYSREQLEREVQALGLFHIEDESNQNTDFDRNFLRHHIIPALKSRFGAIGATASRSARLCAQTQALLDEEAAIKLKPLVGRCRLSGAAILDLSGLFAYSRLWQAQLLRLFMASNGFAPPSEVQLDEALSQLADARADSSVVLRFGQSLLRRYQGALYLESAAKSLVREAFLSQTKPSQPKPFQTLLPESNQPETKQPEIRLAISLQSLKAGLDLPLGKLVLNQNSESLLSESSCPKSVCLEKPDSECVSTEPLWTCALSPGALNGCLTLRYGVLGSVRLQPASRAHSRELKKLWQEFKVPPWLRSLVPLLYCDDKPIAAIGLWVERDFAADCALPATFSLSLSV
ncbi:tRNA lysidine(34) synthetase TilS [Shewanella sp. JM162201]|uniref:tRNA(Ile)-lysidine synthase n=1 Tax=Shewanella jiangmenensis TaxID=2837387 RepID=A0ABS5V582_9GAMM|nr:tRNA lysidine(34) synthetase TilS [Shewanella jiangmenensis]MBT1444781.1 tRNA lysidine(34) synthetase TilS [Shewanella jiangmenensis]